MREKWLQNLLRGAALAVLAVLLAGGADWGQVFGLTVRMRSPERLAAGCALLWGLSCLVSLRTERERLRAFFSAGRGAAGAAFGLVFLPLVLLYSANENVVGSGDTAPARSIPVAVLSGEGFALDAFPALFGGEDRYFLRQGRDGKHFSAYPVGTAVSALPVYAAAYAFGGRPSERKILTLEKAASSALSALAAAFLFLALLGVTRPGPALAAAWIYAAATGAYSTCSQALWQHTGGNFWLAVSLLALVRARHGDRWFFLCGFAAAAAFVCRDLHALWLALCAFLALRRGAGKAARLAAGALLPLAFVAAYNFWAFGALTGSGYYGGVRDAALFWTWPNFPALAGLLLSPSRGLLFFSPVLFLCAAGLWAALRGGGEGEERTPVLRSAALMGALYLAVLSSWKMWWGGWCYGPRLACDLLVFCAVLLVPAVDWAGAAVWRRAALAVLFVFSFAVQLVGVYTDAARWNVRADVDRNPGAVWSIRDSQILYPFQGRPESGGEILLK